MQPTPTPTAPTPPSMPAQVQKLPTYTKKDVQEWRKTADDQTIFNNLYKTDSGFRDRVDRLKPALGQLDVSARRRFPTNVINKHYYNKWELSPTDLRTDAVLQEHADTLAAAAKDAVANSFWKGPNSMLGYAKGIGQGIGNIVEQGANQLNQTLTRVHGGITDYRGPALKETTGNPNIGLDQSGLENIKSVAAVGGDLAGAGLQALGEPLKPGFDAIMQGVVPALQAHPELGKLPVVKTFIADAQNAAKSWEFLSQKYPNEMQAISGGVKMATLPLAISGEAKMIERVGGNIAATGKEAIDTVKPVAQDFAQWAKEGTKVSAPATAKTTSRIQELVQPKATNKVIQQTVGKNPDLIEKPGLLRGGKIASGKQTAALQKTAETIPGFGETDDIVDNAKVVHKAIGTESQQLESALQAKNGALPLKESVSNVNHAVTQAAKDFGEQEGVFKSMTSMWKTTRAKYPGTLLGEWKARIAFDQELEARFGTKIFEKGTARAVAARAVRQASNGLLDSYAQSNGVSYQGQLDRMSDMYDILENLATKAGTDTLRSGFEKALNSRVGRAAVIGVAGSIGAGAIYDATH